MPDLSKIPDKGRVPAVMGALELTEAQAAEQLGCSRSAIQKWKRTAGTPQQKAVRENFELLAQEAVRRITGGEPDAL